MKRESKRRWPTIVGSMVGRMVGLAAVPAFWAPALYYNLDWSDGAFTSDNYFAAGCVIVSAVAIEGSRWVRGVFLRIVCVAAGLVILGNNLQNAIDNLARMADHRADHRQAEISTASHRSSARSEWSAKVGAAREKVGDRPSSEYNSELEQWKASDPVKWTKTGGCKPELVTISRDFCVEYTRRKGLVDTATERDEAAAQVRSIDKAASGKDPPSHIDPYASYVAMMFGITETDHNRVSIRARREAWRALAYEVIATVLPMVWLAVVDGLLTAAPAAPRPAPAPARAAAKVRQEPDTAIPLPSDKVTPEFMRWCADELEEGNTFAIDATPAYTQHLDWRRARNLPHISQKRFGGMMKVRFTRDDNHGYPRYLGVRMRPKAPKLAVVR